MEGTQLAHTCRLPLATSVSAHGRGSGFPLRREWRMALLKPTMRTRMAYVRRKWPMFIVERRIFNNLKILVFEVCRFLTVIRLPRLHTRATVGRRQPARAARCLPAGISDCQQTLPDASLWLRPPRAQTRTSRRRYTRPAAGWLRPSEMMARYRPRASAKRLRWKRGSPR